jgi:hypothetical protein
MFYMLTIVLAARVLNSKKQPNSTQDNLIYQLRQICSFVEIVDSKFIGLFVFLLCNVLTGLVNLSINTLNTKDNVAMIILNIYCLVSFGVPYLVYFLTKAHRKKSD